MKKTAKKILTLILSLLCIVSPGLGAEAAETYGEQMVHNGGFEILTEDGTAEGWDAYKGWSGGFAALTTERVHSGKYAMKIATDSGGSPWVMYKAPASPNTDYRITAKMYTEDINGHVAVKVEWSDPADVYLRGADSEKFEGTSGAWADYTGTCRSMGDVGYIFIYMRLYGTGTLYVDDVELYATSEPPVGGITTDEIFFYPEWTEGNANVKANGTAYENVENGKADIYLKDGDSILESKTGVQLVGGETDWTFSTKKMTEEGKPYVIEAVIYNEAGENIGSCTREVFMYNRPQFINENGDYVDESGEIFVPHIVYHVTDYALNDPAEAEKQYARIRDMGYNVVQMSTGCIYYPELAMQTLDKLQEYGLKGLLPLYDKAYAAGSEYHIENTKKIVPVVKDHPALFAYGVYDEPAIGRNGLTELDMERSYKAIRDIDKKHPTYVVIAPGRYQEDKANMIRQQFTKYADVLCYDPYVACWDDVVSTYVYEIHKAADEVVPHDRPCYTLNQVFDWRGFFPTYDEYRHMWYQAVIGGSKGVGLFSFNDGVDFEKEVKRGLWESEIWEDMLEFAKDEMKVADTYFHLGKYPIFNEVKTEEYLYRAYVDGNDLFMVILRLDETVATSREEKPPVPVSIPLVSANGKVKIGEYSAQLLYGATPKTQNGNGTLDMSLAWRKALVYKITPTTQIDYSSLSAPADNTASAGSTVDLSGLDDMAGYEWAAEAVKEMVETEAMSATGLFRPGEDITRGEFAGLLIRTLGLTGEEGESFADVGADYAYAKEIAIGRAAGVLNGVGENLYAPDAAITRQDMMTIILRTLEAMGKTADKGELTFPDAADISDYAKDAVSAMAAAGVVVGNEAGYFMPLANTTRAEAAVIFHRVKNTAWKTIETEDPPAPEAPDESEPAPEIVFSEGAVSEAETAKREEAIALLRALGIIEEKDLTADGAVTRGQAAKILVRLMGDKSEKGTVQTAFSDAGNLHENSGYIQAAVDMGLMSGYGDGTFGTDDPLAYGAAVKVLVDALGYKPHAESRGGYLSGYLMQASLLELTQGVNILEGPIRGGAFARLIENALDIPAANPATYGENADGSYTVNESITLLNQNHNILKYEGQMTAAYMAQLEAPESALKVGEVVIDGVKLSGAAVDADSLFARRVTAYAPKSEDTPEILYIRARENSTAEVVNDSDVLSGEDRLLVYDTESGEKKVSVSGADLVHNGRPAAWSNTWLPESGKITLVYAGETVETVLVDAYKNYIVDRIDKDKNILYFKDSTDYPEGLTIDDFDITKKIILTDTEGNPLQVNLCDEWNVISIAASADGSVTRAIRGVMSITGKVTESADDTVTIDGTEYGIAANIWGDPAAKRPELGQTAVFYLDMMGEIAAFDTSTKGFMYGFLVAGEISKGVDQKQRLKLFNENGKMVVLETAENVRLDGAVKKGNSLLTDASAVFQGGKVVRQLVRYNTNEDGTLITEITTATNFIGDFINPQRLEVFSMDEYVDDQKLFPGGFSPGHFYGGSMRMFGNRYLARSKTKIFMIPGEGAADEDYSMMDQSALVHNGSDADPKNFYLYDTDEDSVVSVMVWFTDDSSIGGALPDKDNDKTAVIKCFSTKLNADGEAVEVINVVNEDGEEVSLITNEDQQVYFKNVLTDMTRDPLTPNGWREFMTVPLVKTDGNGSEYITLDAGDVVNYSVDSNGVLRSLNCLFRKNYPCEQEIRIRDHAQISSYDIYNNYWEVGIGFGTVLHAGAYGVSVKTHVNNSTTETYPTYIYGTMLLYDSEKETIRTISSSEILEGDKVFHKRRQYNKSFMVIYR